MKAQQTTEAVEAFAAGLQRRHHADDHHPPVFGCPLCIYAVHVAPLFVAIKKLTTKPEREALTERILQSELRASAAHTGHRIKYGEAGCPPP